MDTLCLLEPIIETFKLSNINFFKVSGGEIAFYEFVELKMSNEI